MAKRVNYACEPSMTQFKVCTSIVTQSYILYEEELTAHPLMINIANSVFFMALFLFVLLDVV